MERKTRGHFKNKSTIIIILFIFVIDQLHQHDQDHMLLLDRSQTTSLIFAWKGKYNKIYQGPAQFSPAHLTGLSAHWPYYSRVTTRQTNGFSISIDRRRHSPSWTCRAGAQLYAWRSRASHKWTVARPNVRPGQTLRPEPNGASLRSEPMTLTSFSRKRSGLKAHGSFQMDPSCVIAHMFTMAIVPAGTKNLPTWTSWMARRAHERSGPGGCIRRTSLTTAWRYRRPGTSESLTGREPTMVSSSCWAWDWMFGWRTNLAMIHSKRMATTSVPRNIISCSLASISPLGLGEVNNLIQPNLCNLF